MPIRLFDSLTREVRELKPGSPDGVFRFYNCGLTVYGPAHIGNFRTFLVNDVIRRLLELEFGPNKVRHVRNLTDVDDKTIAEAKEEGRALSEVTRRWTDKFHADCDALNCLPPHDEPAATRFIAEQVNMVAVLMKNGHAYRTPEGSVYFKVSSFPQYGALSRLRDRELQPGAALKAQAADSDEKEDGSDFALWKAWKPEDGPVRWDGPDGAAPGRPGWHIECSAMARALLGETLDLHTGGVDLLFPHHENEIAQSECCTGKPFVRHWYHSEHLLLDGRKMSKSLGNLYTLDDLTARGFSPMAVRYALLAGHPRKQLNFTFDSIHAAESALHRAFNILDPSNGPRVGAFARISPASPRELAGSRFERAFRHLEDDLNIPAALGDLFVALHELEASPPGDDAFPPQLACAKTVLHSLGLERRPGPPSAAAPPEVEALAERRWKARQSRDFKAADQLRAELAASGWSMADARDGYRLEPLKK